MSTTDNNKTGSLPPAHPYANTYPDIEDRLRNPFAFIPPEYREAVERYFYDYDPDEEYMGTGLTHGETLEFFAALLRTLFVDSVYTLIQNTDIDIIVPRYIAGKYARKQAKAQRKVAEAAADAGVPEDEFPLTTTRPIAPDLALIMGSVLSPLEDDPEIRSYRIGRDGPAPALAIEVASKKTGKRDITEKPHIYCYIMGVTEYYAFDPHKGPRKQWYWQGAQIRGWRLVNGTAQEISPNKKGRMWSDVLQSWIGADDLPGKRTHLALWDEDGNRRLTLDQQKDKRAEEERIARLRADARADMQEAARLDADARADMQEAARLDADAARLEAEARAEAERQIRREAEAKTAKAEAARAELEAELRRLRGDA